MDEDRERHPLITGFAIACCIMSLCLPGLGQLMRGRIIIGLIYLLLIIPLWFTILGGIALHIVSGWEMWHWQHHRGEM